MDNDFYIGDPHATWSGIDGNLGSMRELLHEANFSHYHRGFSGNYVVPCSGVDCHAPVFVIALACFGTLLVLFIISVFLYNRIKYRKAFQKGEVPAGMLISGTRYGTGSQHSVKEEKHKFMFYIQRNVSGKEPQSDCDEDGCPVCLKARKEVKVWIVLHCSHQLCERCFSRILQRHRLHSTCPLCRKELAEDICGDGDRGPVPHTPNAAPSSRGTPLEQAEQGDVEA